MTKAELMTLLDQRDILDTEIAAGMTELGLDEKGVKAVRKAAQKVASAQKTLDALMGIDPATAQQLADDTTDSSKED